MRPELITMGETYQVSVPRRMPPERYLNFDIQWFARMSLMKGAKLRLNVLSVDRSTGMVEGVRLGRGSVLAEARLPEATAHELGLPARDGGYWVRSPVFDHEKRVVMVPETVSFTVLARWMRPCTDPAAPEEIPTGTVNVG